MRFSFPALTARNHPDANDLLILYLRPKRKSRYTILNPRSHNEKIILRQNKNLGQNPISLPREQLNIEMHFQTEENLKEIIEALVLIIL